MVTHSAAPAALPAIPGQTLEQHLIHRQRTLDQASGELTSLFSQISLAAKIIASQVSKAGLAGILGLTGEVNVQGEEVKKLDLFANTTLIRCVQQGGCVAVMGSEEVEDPIAIPEPYPCGKYVLQFDPLDGSGNIDINASHRDHLLDPPARDARGHPGHARGPAPAGQRHRGCGLRHLRLVEHVRLQHGARRTGSTASPTDPSIGEFFLSHPSIRIPERGDTYSINQGNTHKWEPGIRRWVDWVKKDEGDRKAYRLRYIGAMVADVHRTLLSGGIFVYPPDRKNPKGKLRLLYEASPLAFVTEAAGGAASTGRGRVLDVVPDALHQRTPLFIGSKDDVADAVRLVTG